MSSALMTVRLDSKLKNRLEKLAKSTDRSKSFLAAEAISYYVKMQEWQIGEIKKGILEADNGQLIEHTALRKKWEKKRADSMGKKR